MIPMFRFILLTGFLLLCLTATIALFLEPASPLPWSSPAKLTPASAFPAEKRRILMIYSYHDTLPWQAKIREALFARLNEIPEQQRPELFEERFEAHRLSPIISNITFLKLVEAKYSKVKLDLLVTVNDYAYDFIRQYPEVFPGVKRQSLNVSEEGGSNVFVAGENGAAAVNTIVQVLPDTKRIIVISGYDKSYSDKLMADVEIARASLAGKNIAVEIWDDFSFAELYQRAGQIPAKDNAILFLPVTQDRLGESQIPFEVMRRLNQVVSVPIFVHHDSFFGAGAVGGYVLSAAKFGNFLADIMLDLPLPKTRAEIDAATKAYYFDENELKRWHIDQRNLPAGSILLNHRESVLYTYRWQISATLLAFALESMLIIALFSSIRQRDRATSNLRRNVIYWSNASCAHQ